nr:Chain B, Histone deacetylase 1 [Homo sapiens]
RIACEEEFSD